MLVGVVRQEVLSGTPDAGAFERLREYLRDFLDDPPTVEDYEDAARCDNICRSAGVAASTVDMLICAIARRLGAPVLTVDRDFDRYAAHLSVRLLDLTA
jgi:predicted nucleic acid-binding protein